MRVRSTVLLSFVLVAASSASALAQTGVSDDRVSLPEGPGSLEGIGDDASVSGNMGALSHSFGIEVPAGFAGVTPQLSLGYSSAMGDGAAGLGWDLSLPSIERLTMRGVPEYDGDDEFVASGNQLVLVATAPDGTQTYRNRFEGTFERYIWHAVADGSEGWWEVEHPDGRRSFFGADPAGNLVADARVSGPDGTFRYHLVATVDRFDHTLRYGYRDLGSYSVIDTIEWVFTDGNTPDYRVRFVWEARPDAMSDATGGFESVLAERLATVQVQSFGTTVRSYHLEYQSEAESGGLSRLARWSRRGTDGTEFAVFHTISWASSGGELCDGNGCTQPFTETMELSGGGGIDLRTGSATLVDMNGDGLPDVVETGLSDSPHRIYLARMASDGSLGFAAAIDSAVGGEANHNLSEAPVQMLDVDGDGFTDIANALTGLVLVNEGGGDWAREDTLFADNGLGGAMLSDFSAGELQTLRFLDYDNDRRIDVIQSQGADAANITTVYRNEGANGFVVDPGVAALGAGFDSDTLELNDINGDGLLDAVQVQSAEVRFKLNLGWGQWSAWRTAPIDASLSAQEAIEAELEDINGDGLSDLVLVSGNSVRLWINRNGASFDAERTVTSAMVNGTIPVRQPETVVLYADMNGNGSSDVVWFEPSAAPVFLDLYPVRPGLVSRIENSVGQVDDFTWASTVEFMARDAAAGEPWNYRLPFPNVVVAELDRWDRGTGLHQVQRYDYRDGYYHPVEKEFRGFEAVTEEIVGVDDGVEDSTTLRTFGLGTSDPYENGLLLTEELIGADGRSIAFASSEYADCAIAGVPTTGLRFPVRWICNTATEQTEREGLSESDWITRRTEYAYDGYGNPTRVASLGVIAGSGGGCEPCTRPAGEYGAPCGAMCTGDEVYSTTTYADPVANDVWILGREVETTVSGEASGPPASVTRTYYDGEAFVGLPSGQLADGLVTRVDEGDGTDTVPVARHRHDAHGNVVEVVHADGEPGGPGNRRVIQLGPQSLRPAIIDDYTDGPDGPYALRTQYRYDELYGDMLLRGLPEVVDQGAAASPPARVELYAYDAHNQLSALAQPGDTQADPTWRYVWEHQATGMRARQTGKIGDGTLWETILCTNARGAVTQRRENLGDGTWRVYDATLWGPLGLKRQTWRPYTSTTEACEAQPPADAPLLNTYSYDANRRLIRLDQVHADNGTASVSYAYLPREVHSYDGNDNDPAHPHADTPTVRLFDGQDRVVAVGRTPSPGAEPEWYAFHYTEAAEIVRLIDPVGNARTQVIDAQGRVVEATDADRGTTRFVYSDGGDLVREERADGAVVRYAYDGMSRKTAEWVEGDEGATRIEYLWDAVPDDCPDGACTNTAGLMSRVVIPGGGERVVDWMGYDVRGDQVWSRRAFGERALDMALTYDNLGRLVAVTLPGGESFDFDLAPRGSVRGVGGLLSVSVDDAGLPETLRFADGSAQARAYDPTGRLAGLEVSASDGTALGSWAWTYDRNGKLVATDAAVAGVGTLAATFAYDAYDRVITADIEAFGTAPEVVSYGWDAADNLASRTSSLTDGSPVHDETRRLGAGPHQMSSVDGLASTWDVSGRLASFGARSDGWDGFDRRATATVDAATATYHYGSTRERVRIASPLEELLVVSDAFVVEDGVASWYVGLGEAPVLRVQYAATAPLVLEDVAPIDATGTSLADGAINAADAWLAFADAEGIVDVARRAARMGAHEVMLRSSARQQLLDDGRRVTALHRDRLGSVLATSHGDALDEVVARYPFGAVHVSTTNAPEPVSFTGHRTDALTGEILVGARNYDPKLGAFTSPDAAFETLDASAADAPWEASGAYIYALNSPLSVNDPNGALGVDDATPRELMTLIKGLTATYSKESLNYAYGGVVVGGLYNPLIKVLGHGWETDAEAFGGELATTANQHVALLDFLSEQRDTILRRMVSAEFASGLNPKERESLKGLVGSFVEVTEPSRVARMRRVADSARRVGKAVSDLEGAVSDATRALARTELAVARDRGGRFSASRRAKASKVKQAKRELKRLRKQLRRKKSAYTRATGRAAKSGF